MSNNIRPTGVKADRNKRTVTISWSDGSDFEYSFAGLRAVCPCVECKDGHDNMGGPMDLDALQNARDDALNLTQIVQAGSYALQFVWSDGHDSGIYTWSYLFQGKEG